MQSVFFHKLYEECTLHKIQSDQNVRWARGTRHNNKRSEQEHDEILLSYSLEVCVEQNLK
jgi:hypothetical protein